MRMEEMKARVSCFPESLKSKKKYAMRADPLLEAQSISWMIAELVIVNRISTSNETESYKQRT